MSVDVICPHCETQFHLQPDMLGKAMRCPDCKDIFTVTASVTPPPLPTEVPYERIENAPPVILEAEALPATKPAVALPPIAKAIPLPKRPRATSIVNAPPRVKSEPGVKEIDWRDAPPPRSPEKPEAPLSENLDLEGPKPPRNIWPAVLTGLIMLILLLGVGTGAIYLFKDMKKEETLTKEAEAAFKDRNFGDAAKKYEELLEKYPDSSNADRHRFFNALSALQSSLAGISLRSDPASQRVKWDAFLKEYGAAPLSRTDDTGYGVDIFDAGRKLLEGYADHAADCLKKFRAENAKREYLDAAERSVAEALALMPVVLRYMPKDVPPLEEARDRLNRLSAEFVRERKRLELIDPYRDLANDPIEERIAEFSAMLARHGLGDDAEARSLINAATLKLRSLLTPVAEFVAPPEVKIPSVERVILTIGIPEGSPPLPPPYTDLPVETVFAVARGWLYALDADRGDLLWTTRVGTTAIPLRIPSSDGSEERIIVTSLLEGRPGVTVRRARTGEALWHQPTSAPVAGLPVVVGNRAYVPLDDTAGTMLEFDLVNGHRLSTFRLRQRIGPGIVRIPESTLIAVVAEARRIFIIDVAPVDALGERLPMKLLHVLRSEHPVLSLRMPPAFVGSGKPTMLLFQNEGINATKVRAVLLPDFVAPPPNTAAPETATTDLEVATLPGQITFPPSNDGERIAIVTDTGAFAIYRTNAPSNLDRGLFTLPNSPPPQDIREPQPALAAISSEDGTWIFSRSQRMFYQQSFSPVTGFKVVPHGSPSAAGLPAQPLQVFAARNAAYVVLRSEASDSWHVTAFDLTSGRERWTRTLGSVTVTTMPLDDSTLLFDVEGGIQKLTNLGAERMASPLVPTTGPARVAIEGNDAWLLVPVAKDKVRIRGLKSGRLVLDVEAALPYGFAGSPVTLGETVIVPLTDGFLYRFDASTKTLLAGPMWRTGANTDAKCYLTAGADEVFASDGNRRISRWRWPSGSDWSAVGSSFETRDRIAFAPAVSGQQLLVADTNGTIVSFNLDRPSDVFKRWRPSGESRIPAGLPTQGFRRFGQLIVYSVNNRHLIAIDPRQTVPAWVISRAPADYDLLDCGILGDLFVATDLAGMVTGYDATGKLMAQLAPKSRDQLPNISYAQHGAQLILPMVDGSILTLPAFPRKTP